MTLICALDHCHSSHQETSSADSRLLTFTANLPPAWRRLRHAQQRSVSVLDFVARAMIWRAPASSKGMPHGPGGSGGDRLAVGVPSVIITADVAVVLPDVTVIVVEIAFLSVDLGALALCGPVIADRVVAP